MYGKQRQWAKKRWYKPGSLPGALTETAHKSDRDITTQEIKSYPKCTTLWSKCFSLSNIYAFFYTRITLPKMHECTFRKPVAQQWIWKLMLSNTLRLAAWNSGVSSLHALALLHTWKEFRGFFQTGEIGDSVALTVLLAFAVFLPLFPKKTSACCLILQSSGITCSLNLRQELLQSAVAHTVAALLTRPMSNSSCSRTCPKQHNVLWFTVSAHLGNVLSLHFWDI